MVGWDNHILWEMVKGNSQKRIVKKEYQPSRLTRTDRKHVKKASDELR
jgi:hypothetical protein